jgi:hypothetical protein
MLEAIKKAMTKQTSEVDMEAFESIKSELSALTEAHAVQAEQLSAAVSELSEFKTKYAAAIEQAVALENEMKEQAEKAFAAKMDDRKKTLSGIVGDAMAEETFTATQALDDKSFAAILSALKLSVKNESESPLFTETGVTGKADETVDPVQALAARIATKFSK